MPRITPRLRSRGSGPCVGRHAGPGPRPVGLVHHVEPDHPVSRSGRGPTPHGQAGHGRRGRRSSRPTAPCSPVTEAFVWVGLEPDHIKTPADLAAVKARDEDELLVVDPAIDRPRCTARACTRIYFLRVRHGPEGRQLQAHPRHAGPGARDRSSAMPTGCQQRRRSRSPQQILGDVGDVTAERLAKLGPPYAAGDQVGLSGLESTYEKRLAGSPTHRRRGGRERRRRPCARFKRFAGQAAQPVRLTHRPRHATSRRSRARGRDEERGAGRDRRRPPARSAAVVSKPDNGFTARSSGTYPPGSTFKVDHLDGVAHGGRQRRDAARRARRR